MPHASKQYDANSRIPGLFTRKNQHCQHCRFVDPPINFHVKIVYSIKLWHVLVETILLTSILRYIGSLKYYNNVVTKKYKCSFWRTKSRTLTYEVRSFQMGLCFLHILWVYPWMTVILKYFERNFYSPIISSWLETDSQPTWRPKGNR